jgi:membrane-associated phospholipid phosphatase
MFKLIKIVNNNNRLYMGVFLLGWIVTFYSLPNKYLINIPTLVPTTIVDDFIRLSPGWTWIYISYYGYLAFAFLFAKKEQNMNQIFYSFVSTAALSAVFFFTYPTMIVRDLYPLGLFDGASAWALEYIRVMDESVCCAPSMHITMTTIAALTIKHEAKKLSRFTDVWALLIFYSTMATKQHYFIDVVTGFLFGLSAYLIFSNIEYVTWTSKTSSNSQTRLFENLRRYLKP